MNRDLENHLRDEIAKLFRQTQALTDEIATLRAVNADQAKRLGAYVQEARERMARGE